MFTDAKQETQRGVGISIRRAELSDYPVIAAFLREAYLELAPFKGKQRWDWQFVDNPYTKFDDNDVPVWIAETGGKVVGQIAVQEGALELDGTAHSSGWIVDVMILPSYRGHGLGHQLYAAVAKECPILVTLTMAGATRRLAERLGALDLGEVKLYWRGVRLDHLTVKRYLLRRTVYHPRINKVVDTFCRHFFMHRVVTGGGSLLLSLRNVFISLPRARKDTLIIETDRFGPEIDKLWRRLRPDFPASFTRESKFLNWRFRDCPQMRYRCFIASREGVPVGYIVLRQTEAVELPQGIIVDLLAARQDRDTGKDLVAFALEFFGNGVSAVQCATSVPEFSYILRKFGFYAVHKERPNCVVEDAAIRKRLERSSADWLFSKADHDWDQIHLA